MKWIARLLEGIGLKRKQESDAPADHQDTVRIDVNQLKQEKSLGAEVHEWLDETQRMTEKDSESGQDSEQEDDDHTRTVPTLKESDLPDLDKPDDE